MKKLIIFLVLSLFLVGTISAFEFDNSIKYSNNDLKVTIKNAFGLGEELGTAELKSHHSVDEFIHVGLGEQIVMFYDNAFSKAQSLGEVYFTNIRTGEIIEKNYEFVIWKEIEKEVKDYGEVCESSFINGTKKDCSYQIIKTHKEKNYGWVKLENNEIPKGKSRIGLRVNVELGDKIDGVLTIAGKKVSKHAGWTADLNTNLIAMWSGDESSGTNYQDNYTLTYNGTGVNGTTAGVAGKVGLAPDFGADDLIQISDYPRPAHFTIMYWAKFGSFSAAEYVVGMDDAAVGNGEKSMHIQTDTAHPYAVLWVGASAYPLTNSQNLDTNTWHHFVYKYDGSNFSFYVDSVLNNSNTAMSGDMDSGTGLAIGAASDEDTRNIGDDNKVIDEVIIYNESVSQSVIDNHYNSGNGIAFERIAPLGSPNITLNSPANESTFKLNNVTLNCTGFDNSAVVNVSVLLDGAVNETNSSGINNTYYTFDKIVTEGEHNWTCRIADDDSNFITADARIFTIDYLVEEAQFYNSSTFETAQEKFTINISTNGTSLTSAQLFYGGIGQGTATKSGTDSNANFSDTIQIPEGVGNNSIIWQVTLGSESFNTTEINQSVAETIWTRCNATYPTTYLNISFKDEGDLSVVNATIPNAEFEYYLGDGSITKTYSFSETTANYSYEFCASPPNRTIYVDPYVQYKNEDSPQRIYNPSLTSYTNITTNETLYLLSTADGLYVTFQVINSAEQAISGVSVNASREIDSEEVLIGQGTTGDDGGVTFWLNPDFLHTFFFVKSSYSTYTTSLTPTQSSYTITMQSTGGSNASDYSQGIDYTIEPRDSYLINGTYYEFRFNLTSSYWELSSFGFNITDEDGDVVAQNSSSAASGGSVSLNISTESNETMSMVVYWIVNSTISSASTNWIVLDVSENSYSIYYLIQDFKTYAASGIFGMDTDTDAGKFALGLICFVLIFVITGILNVEFGANNPATISGLIFSLVLFFDVGVGLLPNPVDAVTNFPTIFMGVIFLGFLFKEVFR